MNDGMKLLHRKAAISCFMKNRINNIPEINAFYLPKTEQDGLSLFLGVSAKIKCHFSVSITMVSVGESLTRYAEKCSLDDYKSSTGDEIEFWKIQLNEVPKFPMEAIAELELDQYSIPLIIGQLDVLSFLFPLDNPVIDSVESQQPMLEFDLPGFDSKNARNLHEVLPFILFDQALNCFANLILPKWNYAQFITLDGDQCKVKLLIDDRLKLQVFVYGKGVSCINEAMKKRIEKLIEVSKFNLIN